MAWDNNPGRQQEGLPDLPEMIKKVGDSLSLRKLNAAHLLTRALL
jgi:hypothetical protein